MNYLWQHSDWPHFTYDQTNIPSSTLYAYSQRVGRLSLSFDSIPAELKMDAVIDLMVQEAITTSAIEGENLNKNDVRSSLKNHLGLSYPAEHIRDPRAKGISALMVNNYRQNDISLSAEVLFQWHRMLLPNDYDTWGNKIRIGEWRTEGIEVVSGALNKQKTHFEGPPASSVEKAMEVFFDWYNRTNPMQLSSTEALIPGPIRSALAHLWFVTIHPFDDGNGRIARAISDHALAQDARYPMLHSLSTAIDRNRNEYYEKLEETQSGSMDVLKWVLWFLEITVQSIEITEKIIAFTVQKSNFIQQFKDDVNERQLQVLLGLFSNGAEGDMRSINRNKYVSQTHCSPSTALRDLKNLVDKAALKQLPGLGRNTRYGLNVF